MHLAFKGEHEEFTVIRVNLSIVRGNDEEHLYNKNDLYFEPNNAGHHNIV